MPENGSTWAKAEILARRNYELTTVPMRSKNHPTWDPKWRLAINQGLSAIGTGDDPTMERALMDIEDCPNRSEWVRSITAERPLAGRSPWQQVQVSRLMGA